MTQMISAIQVLNFNRRRARLGVTNAGYWMLEAEYSLLVAGTVDKVDWVD
jgi:hypothetical protein